MCLEDSCRICTAFSGLASGAADAGGACFRIGGVFWLARHLLLTLVVPQTGPPMTILERLAIYTALAAGTPCTFIYLACVYVKWQSIFVAALAHIVVKNAAQSFNHVFVLENSPLANLATVLVMLLVIVGLHAAGEFKVFRSYLP